MPIELDLLVGDFGLDLERGVLGVVLGEVLDVLGPLLFESGPVGDLVDGLGLVDSLLEEGADGVVERGVLHFNEDGLTQRELQVAQVGWEILDVGEGVGVDVTTSR